MSVVGGADALRTLSPQRRELLERLLRQQRREPATVSGDSTSGMAISLFFFSSDLDDRAADKYELVLRCAELADQLGLHAVWAPERHFDPFGAPYPSPAVLLSAVAARTHRIQLRAGSVVLPLRDPLRVAEEWGMLDAISQQRIGVSLASGWHADDFVLDPDSFEGRKAVLVERLGILRRLWDGEAITRQGPDGRSVEIRTYPRPERQPDVWLTSSVNPATWEAAGQLNLHVLTALLEQTVDELAGKADAYRAALAASGHPAEGKQITCMLHTHLAPDAAEVSQRVKGPLMQYLSAHMRLFEKFAQHNDVGVSPDALTDTDRAVLMEHGLRRYMTSAGLFGTVETCRPMVDRLAAAGVTELGCLIDFGLPPDQVMQCVAELGKLQALVRS